MTSAIFLVMVMGIFAIGENSLDDVDDQNHDSHDRDQGNKLISRMRDVHAILYLEWINEA